MNRNMIQFLGAGISILVLIVVIFLVLFTRSGANFRSIIGTDVQQDPGEALQARLVHLGISVQEVSITDQSPLTVEIVLNNTGDTTTPTVEDHWHGFLAEREAQLAYLNLGFRIAKYTILMVNGQGEKVYKIGPASNTPGTYSQELTGAMRSQVNDLETRELMLQDLTGRRMELLSLNVQSDFYTRQNTKYVYLEMTTGTDEFKEADRRINGILGGMRNYLKDFNSRTGAQVSLIRVRITDPQGQLMAYYFYDFDRKHELVWLTEGIDAEWMPSPAEDFDVEPAQTPTPIIIPGSTPASAQTPYP